MLVLNVVQVLVELASDSKDFASALAKTQLAEMRNPKILPIPTPSVKTSGVASDLLSKETTSAAKPSAAAGNG
jgi:hypothetical protein